MLQSILITGGAGYIGSILVPELLSIGHQVTVIDNFMYGQASLNQLCTNPNFRIINGDIRLENIVKPALVKADIVIPLAAYVGAPLCNKDPIGATSINKDAIVMMLQLMSNDQYIIMPTTNSAYGSGDKNNFCDENSPLNPISLYAKDKVAVEKKLMEHQRAISFRLATVFGMSPRMRTDLLVNDFTYRAVNDKFVVLFESHFKRNYIHIRDVASAFLHALHNLSSMQGQIFNIGLSEANVSKFELCQEIQKQLPEFVFLEAPLAKDPDQRDYIVSNAKIEATGFKPVYSLRAGIQELIKGYTMINNNKYGNI